MRDIARLPDEEELDTTPAMMRGVDYSETPEEEIPAITFNDKLNSQSQSVESSDNALREFKDATFNQMKSNVTDTRRAVEAQVAEGNLDTQTGKEVLAKLDRGPKGIDASRISFEIAKAEGKAPKPADNFLNGMSLILAPLLGGAIGGLLGGTEGFVAGAGETQKVANQLYNYEQNDMKMKQSLRKEQQAQANFEREMNLKEDKLKNQGTSIEQQRLDLSRKNTEIRIAELKEQAKRTGNLEADREARRMERDHAEALKIKDKFIARPDINKNIAQIENLKDIDNLADIKILPGVIGFKIAKGIGGEVGNLTSEERAAAQISPSIWRKMKRWKSENFKGELLPEDIKELKMAAKKLRGWTYDRLSKKASDFATSRKKALHPNIGNVLESDLQLELGIVPKETPRQKLERLRKMKSGGNK